MGELVVSKLHGDIQKDSFDCGNDSINNMVYQSYYPTLLKHAYAFQVQDSISRNVLGYYMIKFRSIKISNCPDDISEYEGSLVNDCCALHISYVAVGKRYQRHNIGSSILKLIISAAKESSKQLPILLITIDALRDKTEWYEKLGFSYFEAKDTQKEIQSTVPMYIDCIENRQLVYDYCNELI